MATPTIAGTEFKCVVDADVGIRLNNQAQSQYVYQNPRDNPVALTGISNSVKNQLVEINRTLTLTSQGIRDSEGNRILGLGLIADGLRPELRDLGLSQEETEQAIVEAIVTYVTTPRMATMTQTVAEVKLAMAEALPEKANLIQQLSSEVITRSLIGLASPTLNNFNLTSTEQEAVTQAIQDVMGSSGDAPLAEINEVVFEVATASLSVEKADLLNQVKTGLTTELNNIRLGRKPSIQPNDVVYYHFLVENVSNGTATLTLPDLDTLTETGLQGAGTITEVQYQYLSSSTETAPETTPQSNSIAVKPNEKVAVIVEVKLNPDEDTKVQSVGLEVGSECSEEFVSSSVTLIPNLQELVDPFGRVTGCRGEILPDYTGFSIGLYEPDSTDPTGGVSGVVTLTMTEVPDDPNNDVPLGIEPNIQNSNPFFLTNADEGQYSFLFDREKGQLDQGRTYILVVNPPDNSIYSERRLRLEIGEEVGDVITYTATSLDGRPISFVDPLERTTIQGEIVVVENAERVGLDLAVLDLNASVCQAQEIRIDKMGDRSAAEPGDTVIYRLSIRNLSADSLSHVVITDTLPAGFNFIADSVRTDLEGNAVAIATEQNDRTLTFSTPATLESGQVLNLAYAAQLTPDAVRGSGRNSAIVNGRVINREVKDGPVSHRLEIRPGIVADCGTLIGRVFVDKNFDGEQQYGEPGVPNAVIFLEDGNRITTDENGLFSLANVLPGYHTGVLDLSSLPGYTLAPNDYFIERNSPSRLVHLAPGGMVRMNFGVTPTLPEEEQL